MISYSQLGQILLNNDEISSEGKLILENALLSGRSFLIMPDNALKEIAAVECAATVFPVPIPFDDVTSILCNLSVEQWRRCKRLRRRGIDILFTMIVYPDDKYEQLPN